MKKLITLFFILGLALTGQAQVSKTINISPGTLSFFLTVNELNTVNNLTITGIIDARDFKTLRDLMPSLTTLDLSETRIAAYSGTSGTLGVKASMLTKIKTPLKTEYDLLSQTRAQQIKLQPKTNTSNYYPVNEIPQYAFCDPNTQILQTRLKSVIMPNSVTSIASYAFYGCTGLTRVTIPSSVTSIGNGAFYACSGLTSVTIPSSVTSIGVDAFAYCTSLTIAITPFGSDANYHNVFSGCTNLKTITIPDGVTSIGNYAFYGCSWLTNVTIPSSVTSIGSYAFAECSGLTSVSIPSSVISIGDDAFYYCSGLTSVTISGSVTSIGSYAFAECSGLTSVSIPSSVTSIGSSAFEGCSGLTSVTIPSSVTSIGSWAFGYCSGLTSVTIPSSVTSIGSSAFEYCYGLTSVTIPSSVTSIGDEAFYYCSGLTSIYAYPVPPVDLSTVYSVFFNVNTSTCTLYVPTGSKAAYQAAVQWQNFTNIVEFVTAVPTVNDENINIYPNPVIDGFRIKDIEGTSELRLIDLNGKVLLNKQVIGNEKVSLTEFPAGMYMIKLSNNGVSYQMKFIKK